MRRRDAESLIARAPMNFLQPGRRESGDGLSCTGADGEDIPNDV